MSLMSITMSHGSPTWADRTCERNDAADDLPTSPWAATVTQR
jgi:hypothetical protein